MARNNHLHNFVYIVVNSRDRYVLSSGYDFADFTYCLQEPLNNLLLLKHQYQNPAFHYVTQMDYIPKESVNDLLQSETYKTGHFCWVDFEDIFNLDTLEGQELAELLFLGHTKRHLTPPFYQELNNQFAYLTEQDGVLNRTYYKNWNDFYTILGGVLVKKLAEVRSERSWLPFQKKKSYPRVPATILHQLSTVLTEGVVFSFSMAKIERSTAEIPFWVVGDFYDIDDMVETFQQEVEKPATGRLVFDKKQREWNAILTNSFE